MNIRNLKNLDNILSASGYIKSTDVPCHYLHVNSEASFVLVVDNFLIKYSNEKSIQHSK